MPMLAPRNTSLPFTENGGDSSPESAPPRARRLRARPRRRGQRKPVAAAARKRLGLAQTAGQPLGRELDQSVPGQMPQRVVDAFEAVQIQIEQRGHPALPAGAPRPGETGLRRRIDWAGPEQIE